LAERDVRARLARRAARRVPEAAPTVPASRTRLLALPGGLSEDGRACQSVAAGDPGGRPGEEPRRKPAGKPATPAPGPVPAEPAPEPARRPVPTPGEVFPRRRPTPPPANPEQQRLAAG
ncbi:hypothetical protein AB0L81_30825, partial [Streptomyces sp. NPDC052127]